MRILVLGGSSEATLLAKALSHRADLHATLSLAGRTENPAALPLPTRIGGFGGVEGLIAWLQAERIDAVIDATHPFAAQMKRHAAQACAATTTPLCAFTRAPWVAGEGDNWIEVDDATDAARALGDEPKRVFLTTGRQQAGAFAGQNHNFVLRTIDAPDADRAARFARSRAGARPLHNGRRNRADARKTHRHRRQQERRRRGDAREDRRRART